VAEKNREQGKSKKAMTKKAKQKKKERCDPDHSEPVSTFFFIRQICKPVT